MHTLAGEASSSPGSDAGLQQPGGESLRQLWRMSAQDQAHTGTILPPQPSSGRLLLAQHLPALPQHVAVQHGQAGQVAEHDGEAGRVVAEPKVERIRHVQGQEAGRLRREGGEGRCGHILRSEWTCIAGFQSLPGGDDKRLHQEQGCARAAAAAAGGASTRARPQPAPTLIVGRARYAMVSSDATPSGYNTMNPV